jgi:hypothetical protein
MKVSEYRKELTSEEKVVILERIVKAIFNNGSETEIEYTSLDKDMKWIEFECDVDNAVKVLNFLDNGGINYDFRTSERELSVEDQQLWGRPMDGYTTITLYIETEYWKKCKELEKENKSLHEKVQGLGKIILDKSEEPKK